MSSSMNFIRQIAVFSPTEYGESPIDVIGAGATGSKVVMELVKTGFNNIRVWDADTVESHNVPNQAFGLQHSGQKKTEALRDMVKLFTGVEIEIRNEFFIGQEKLRKYVYLLVDSMAMRKQIWEKSIKRKLNVSCMIETRMSVDSGRIYILNPMNSGHIKDWEDASAYGDKKTNVSACGTESSIGATSSLIAAIGVWQLMKWLMTEEVENEIIFTTREKFELEVRSFKNY